MKHYYLLINRKLQVLHSISFVQIISEQFGKKRIIKKRKLAAAEKERSFKT
jgi:hypothetical protein